MQQFIDGLPWSVKQAGRGLGAVAMTYIGSLSETFAPYAIMGGGILALWVIVGSVLHFVNHNRAKNNRDPVNIDYSYVMIFALAVALIAAVLSRIQAPTAAKNDPKSTISANQQYVSNQQIGAAFSSINEGESQPLIRYFAQVVKSLPRVRIFLDISNQVAENSKPDYQRIQLSDERDLYRGKHLDVVVATRTVEKQNRWVFRWGKNTEGQDFAGTYYARIVLMDDNGVEQRLYFMIVPSTINGMPYVQTIEPAQLAFAEKWERVDVK